MITRTIKFRYWNDVTKQMVNNPSMPYKEGWTIEQLFSDRGWVWMQFTGLLDRHGVEIYEGDIILTADDLRKQSIGNWKPKMRLVEWTDNKEYKTGFNLGKAQDGKCEVIGNIYENPELLKED